VSANGRDFDGTAGTAGNESPEAGRMPGARDMAAGQAEPAPDPLPTDPLVPGLAVRSPALDYMLANQRRRGRRAAAVAASILAIAVVAAVVATAVHSVARKIRSAELTAAQIVQQAARQQERLNSESATFSVQISGQANATVAGTFELRRQPLLEAMTIQMNLTSEAMTERAILAGDAMYIKLGSVKGLPRYLAGKWLKIPLTGLSQPSQFAAVQRELLNENPAAQFAEL
jgi:hypothetical protein